MTEAFDDAQLARLGRLGEVRSVTDLAGGRGRTFLVEHAPGPTSTAEPLRSVVHVRRGGVVALEREAAATRRAHAAGVGPEVLDVVPDLGLLVTRWVSGEALVAADLSSAAVLEPVGSSIRRLHDAPTDAGLPVLAPTQVRRAYLERAARLGLSWSTDVVAESRRVDELVAAMEADSAPLVGAHGDLVPGNLVRGPDGSVTVLDHEYAGLAEPAFDLGGLAATAELDDAALALLTAAYAGPSLERVRAWRDITRHAWFVWVELGEDLGPAAAHWRAWAARAREGWEGRPGR